jgi:hypothetical protein
MGITETFFGYSIAYTGHVDGKSYRFFTDGSRAMIELMVSGGTFSPFATVTIPEGQMVVPFVRQYMGEVA